MSTGKNHPGLLDKLAAAVKDVAASATSLLAGGADPAAAADLQPGAGRGEATGIVNAELDQPPASLGGSAVRPDGSNGAGAVSAGGEAVVGSQEWLAQPAKLPDQSPPDQATPEASSEADADSAQSAAEPAQQQRLDAGSSLPSDGADQQLPVQPPTLTEEQLERAVKRLPPKAREAAKTKIRASWSATDARGGSSDYLYELGNTDYNTNVDVGESEIKFVAAYTSVCRGVMQWCAADKGTHPSITFPAALWYALCSDQIARSNHARPSVVMPGFNLHDRRELRSIYSFTSASSCNQPLEFSVEFQV